MENLIINYSSSPVAWVFCDVGLHCPLNPQPWSVSACFFRLHQHREKGSDRKITSHFLVSFSPRRYNRAGTQWFFPNWQNCHFRPLKGHLTSSNRHSFELQASPQKNWEHMDTWHCPLIPQHPRVQGPGDAPANRTKFPPKGIQNWNSNASNASVFIPLCSTRGQCSQVMQTGWKEMAGGSGQKWSVLQNGLYCPQAQSRETRRK